MNINQGIQSLKKKKILRILIKKKRYIYNCKKTSNPDTFLLFTLNNNISLYLLLIFI